MKTTTGARRLTRLTSTGIPAIVQHFTWDTATRKIDVTYFDGQRRLIDALILPNYLTHHTPSKGFWDAVEEYLAGEWQPVTEGQVRIVRAIVQAEVKKAARR